MSLAPFVLAGASIRLEPLELHHAAGLVAATDLDRELYSRTYVPFNVAEANAYIEAALALRNGGVGIAFAVVHNANDQVVGSTRYWDLERWPWKAASPHDRGQIFDCCEIGYTWLSPATIRTSVNTEQKLLMLKQAFEVWGCASVHFHTDERNLRSAAALTRIGAKLEGTLRAHRIAADGSIRNSLRFSIVASEWPDVKAGLEQRLSRDTLER